MVGGMGFSVWPSPERPWADVLEIVQACDERGWHGVYFADHFMPNDLGGEPLDGPVLECWAVMAGLAAATQTAPDRKPRVRQPLPSSRVVAKAAATVDHISGGRFVLGVGAGWQVNEHNAYGIDLLDTKARLDRFEAACEIITSLLREHRTTLEAPCYRITTRRATRSRCSRRCRCSSAARASAGRCVSRLATRRVERVDHRRGVPPEDRRARTALRRSRPRSVVDHALDAGARCTSAPTRPGSLASVIAIRFVPCIVGTPAEVVEQVAAYRDAGVDELIVPDWTMGKPPRAKDTLELFWTEVAAPSCEQCRSVRTSSSRSGMPYSSDLGIVGLSARARSIAPACSAASRKLATLIEAQRVHVVVRRDQPQVAHARGSRPHRRPHRSTRLADDPRSR